MQRLDTNGFFSNLVCSFIAGSIANIFAKAIFLLMTAVKMAQANLKANGFNLVPHNIQIGIGY